MNNKVYFFSDAHLGSIAIKGGRERELKVVRFLDRIKSDAVAIYIMGDLFDFWHEYRYTVPKGYTRLLGKLSELTDSGIEVHFFTGNHDLWCGDYLEKECGLHIHHEAQQLSIMGHSFYMGHGDGLDKTDRHYLLLRSLLHSHLCQKLFASVHPRWGIWLGQTWAGHSRKKHEGLEGYFDGPDKDGMVDYVRQYLKAHPDIEYFIFGHRHVDVDLMLTDTTRFVILGDWIEKFTYAAFDGEQLSIHHFAAQL
ncbi:MAG: UDP-2,3-diacylglucosamine diphosphatase [Bacteroidaceae bacterium]|nr:UDP-2,3-diacylglucosamine diphosphatase [Bacteroidaceae bacterium]